MGERALVLGTLTSARRIERLWRLREIQGGQRLAFADVARLVTTLTPGRFVPESGGQGKVAEARTICAGCQVPDPCPEVPVKAAGELSIELVPQRSGSSGPVGKKRPIGAG